MMEAFGVVDELVRRLQTGKPVADLFAADFRAARTHSGLLLDLPPSHPDELLAAVRTSGYSAHVRGIKPGPDGRVLIEAIWQHHASTGGGTAALFFAVPTVRKGLIAENRYFSSRPEAEAYAGIS